MRRQFNIGFQVALLAIIGLQTRAPLRAKEVPSLVSTRGVIDECGRPQACRHGPRAVLLRQYPGRGRAGSN